jgi:uncharacterized protein (DUF1800 family)
MTRKTHVSRRFAAIVTLSGVLALTSEIPTAQRSAVPSRPDERTVAHVLNRIGFGARPGDVARVQQIGLAAYIEQQLSPAQLADGALTARLSEFQTLNLSTSELADQYFNPADQLRRAAQQAQARAATGDPNMMAGAPPPPSPPSPEQRMAQQNAAMPMQELMQAKILRATLSERQLEEVLVDFWFNHFNVFVGKGQVRQYLTEYERDAIRPHVLGNFRTLLGATAHSPAMLFYLDNFQSRTANPPMDRQQLRRLQNQRRGAAQIPQLRQRLEQMEQQQRRPQGGLNENYARELMELHTLGVDGGYTQQDVIEVAKILTGWTIDRPQQGGGFVFRPQMHERGSKTVMGRKFSEDGEKEGERLLDMLATHPNTAKHISFKLAQRFVADQPPAALVERAAKKFLDTKGDLREVTRLIITSPEFFDQKYVAAKVKTPLEFVISAARATNAHMVSALPVVQALRDLGMPLYGAQPPTGYSMTADAWVNTGALLNRMNFAVQLLNGGQPQRVTPPPPMDGQPGADPMMQRPNRQGGPGRQGQPPPPGGGQRGRGLDQRVNQLGRGPIQVDVRSIAPDTTPETIDRVVTSILVGQASDSTRQTIARATTPQQLVALTLGSPEFQKR